MARRSKYLALGVIVVPVLWYVIASTFFSGYIYPWWIVDSMPLAGNAIQVANEDRTDLCQKIGMRRLYITDTAWDAVYQSYLDYFRLHYNGAVFHIYPNAEKDNITVVKIMEANIITLQRRNISLSVRRIREAGPTMGPYIWTSNDSNVQDAVAKANSAYAISISYISNVEAYRENCTD